MVGGPLPKNSHTVIAAPSAKGLLRPVAGVLIDGGPVIRIETIQVLKE
jgi:hypothetical protein